MTARRPITTSVHTLLIAIASCRAPMDSLQVVLERHAQATARLPDEQRKSIMPYGAPVTPENMRQLLPTDVLTLEKARSIALRAAPDVHAAQARLQLALARVAETRARYYPSLVFSHNSTRTFQTPASRNRLGTALQPSPVYPSDIDSQSFALTTLLNALRRPLSGLARPTGNSNSFSEHATSLTSTWTLFDGFMREAQLMSAKHLHVASTQSLLDVQRLIVRSVDAAYHQVQLAREQVRIARAAEEFSFEQWEETRKLQAAGRASSADADNFHVRVLAAQAELAAAEGRRETGRVLLAELMGIAVAELPPSLDLSPLDEETEDELVTPDPGEWIAAALSNRPDLMQLDHIRKSEEENVRAAKGAYQPVVLASASWGFDRISNLNYDDQDQSSAAGVELRWEIFNGGAREARIRAAESLKAESDAHYNRLLLAVQAEVRSAIIDVLNSQRQIRLQRENVATALENRRIIRAGYLGGKETLTRLNEAQRDYITSDADLALARVRLRQAWSDLRAAAGVSIDVRTNASEQREASRSHRSD